MLNFGPESPQTLDPFYKLAHMMMRSGLVVRADAGYIALYSDGSLNQNSTASLNSKYNVYACLFTHKADP